MIKDIYRLKSPKDFRRTYQKGNSLAGPFLILYYFRHGRDNYRIGFSISKKIGKAVVRNKVKRRLREICRLNEHLFVPGYDYIFIARAKIKETGYFELQKALIKLVNKAGVTAHG